MALFSDHNGNEVYLKKLISVFIFLTYGATFPVQASPKYLAVIPVQKRFQFIIVCVCPLFVRETPLETDSLEASISVCALVSLTIQ